MKKVKICGLSRYEDIKAVNELCPDYCGFVIDFEKSKRNVSSSDVQKLTLLLNEKIIPVGVFVNEPIDIVARLLNSGIIKVAQLHGNEDNEYIRLLREHTGGVIWQAFQVKSDEDISNAEKSLADFVLLDAGQGAGKVFDWKLLESISFDFGLAGGLNFDNLPLALTTKAKLLDVSGGVETDGYKDYDKIKRFIDTIRDCE